MSIITVTIPFPGGTATMADSTALAIEAQTIEIGLIAADAKLFREANFGPAGLLIPGSMINQMQVMAASFNDTTVILGELLEKQKQLIAQLSGVQTALSAVSSQVAAGVTTQQLSVADQIKSNKFQQLNTNAALARAELPAVEVKPDNMTDSIKATVTDVSAIKLQVTASQLVESNITAAVAWTTTQVGNIVQESFIGTAAASAKTAIKGFLKIVDPPILDLQLVKQSAARATKAGLPPLTGEP